MYEDLIFLVKKDKFWSDVLIEVLENNNIPFMFENDMGTKGSAVCRYFFVPKEFYEQAADIVTELFGEENVSE